MINLFNIPNYTINTANFSSLLHDNIVNEFTQNFCQYVGGKYGCAINSATNAIFLFSYYNKLHFKIPTMLPPVVLNAIINGGSTYEFVDNTRWVGNSYILYEDDSIRIIDSAQEVVPRGFDSKDIIIYSFYPTKPIGGCDGGMIVSNNKGVIDKFKILVMNGTSFTKHSWERQNETPGWKMYMNSIQAHITQKNLNNWRYKEQKLKDIARIYMDSLDCFNSYKNFSRHLYRILVEDQERFITHMKNQGIVCGIHYPCLHFNPLYNYNNTKPSNLYYSEFQSKHTISIPFHENLTSVDIKRIIQCIKDSGMLIK